MEKNYKYTVYEYKDSGARYFTSYKGHDITKNSNIQVVEHCTTPEEAQEICDETEFKNWQMFWGGLFSL